MVVSERGRRHGHQVIFALRWMASVDQAAEGEGGEGRDARPDEASALVRFAEKFRAAFSLFFAADVRVRTPGVKPRLLTSVRRPCLAAHAARVRAGQPRARAAAARDGQDPNLAGEDGFTPFMAACARPHRRRALPADARRRRRAHRPPRPRAVVVVVLVATFVFVNENVYCGQIFLYFARARARARARRARAVEGGALRADRRIPPPPRRARRAARARARYALIGEISETYRSHAMNRARSSCLSLRQVIKLDARGGVDVDRHNAHGGTPLMC